MTCREGASDGQITLGVPVGTDIYVQNKVVSLVKAHDNRLRGLALLADATGDEVERRDANLALQCALHGLRLSANARSAHFLRNVPWCNVQAGIEAHDRGVRNAVAVALQQMPMPTGPLCDADPAAASESFQSAWPRMTLHTAARGLGLREWSNYSNAAYIGCWAQAWKVTQRKLDDTVICVLPALAHVLEEADLFRSVREHGHAHMFHITDMAKSLHDAWESCVTSAITAFPEQEDRAVATCPANWVELTGGGEIQRLAETPDRMQRKVSRCVNRLVAAEYAKKVSSATHYGAVTQAQRYRDAGDAHCGDVYTAAPWLQTGELDISSYALKKTLITRFALDVPHGMRAPRRCSCGKCIQLPDAPWSADDVEIAQEAERMWLRHRYTCPSASGLRIATHDNIARVWYAMLEAAGFQELAYEPRRWDAEAKSDEAEHRRPDILAFNPCTFGRWVMDVSMAWAAVGIGADCRLAAKAREAYKQRAYKASMARVKTRHESGEELAQEGWLDDRFVPLGFEVGGAWGPSAVHAFHEVLEVYAQTNMVDIEHHSVISFATHWRERVAMAITRGAAAVVARVAPLDGEAATVVGTADTSHEHNPDAR